MAADKTVISARRALLEKAFPKCVAGNPDYAQEWFLTHTRIASNGLYYFQIIEEQIELGEHASSSRVEQHFQSQIGPLNLRGTLKGTRLHVHVGFASGTSVFYKLADVSNDLITGTPITTIFTDDKFYKGDVTFSLTSDKLLAKVNFTGLGTDGISDATIELIEKR